MDIKDLRKRLKTECHKTGYDKQIFYEGVENIRADLIDFPKNPYRSIYEMALSTWGHDLIKWPSATPEERFFIVLQALLGNTLPTALESAKFTFAISGASRAAFDQIARARSQSPGFAAMGIRDNSHYNFPFRIPKFFRGNKVLELRIRNLMGAVNKLYKEIIEEHKGSYQAARCILPMNMCYNFTMTIDFRGLKHLCSQRMSFCEQEDTVAIAWLLKENLSVEFPLLADFLWPACDSKGECLYSNKYRMSHLFGELFAPCGRHTSLKEDGPAEFNSACSDFKTLEDQLPVDTNNYNRVDLYKDLNMERTPEFMKNNITDKDQGRFNEDN